MKQATKQLPGSLQNMRLSFYRNMVGCIALENHIIIIMTKHIQAPKSRTFCSAMHANVVEQTNLVMFYLRYYKQPSHENVEGTYFITDIIFLCGVLTRKCYSLYIYCQFITEHMVTYMLNYYVLTLMIHSYHY